MGEAGGGSTMRPHSQGTYRIAVSFPIDWGSPVRHSFAAARLLPIFSCSPPEFYKRHLFQENTSTLPLSLLKVLNSSPPTLFNSNPTPVLNPLPDDFPGRIKSR
ncbi:hypothetical protein TNCT_622391 [Trichonephila clavata]|uniref:Uncharacterized protein n=1 Tax=Trichonephila clavata TaxID=2740835 RepID=A0A8X6LAA9_TRICU|nr:hypothetical protein TNCT_622391 [Trichonephila clavata]